MSENGLIRLLLLALVVLLGQSMRSVLAWLALFLGAVGLMIFAFDGYISHRYGFHFTEVAGIDADGSPIAWPTGEEPFFMQFPPSAYAVGFFLAGAGVYASRLAVGRSSHGSRVGQGME